MTEVFIPESITNPVNAEPALWQPTPIDGHNHVAGIAPYVPVSSVFAHRQPGNPRLYAEDTPMPSYVAVKPAGTLYGKLAETPIVTELAEPNESWVTDHTSVKQDIPVNRGSVTEALVPQAVLEPQLETSALIDEAEVISSLKELLSAQRRVAPKSAMVNTGERILGELNRKAPGLHSPDRPMYEANRRGRLRDALGILAYLQSAR